MPEQVLITEVQIAEGTLGAPDPFIPAGLGRVKYSRFGESNIPKNTLYVLNADGVHFFGIARCNLKDDACVKSHGRTLALQRAVEAYTRHKHSKSKVVIDPDGLTGRCDREFLDSVHNYFFAIDRKDDEEADDEFW